MADEEPTWEELLGSNNWDNLLDPLNLSLRHLILRSGDFCQATYDAFVNDQNSIYCGASRYGKNSFFHKVMLDSAEDYEVSTFLYATARVSVPEALLLKSQSRESWDRESNWIGYIAVTTDERTEAIGRREIYVAFRGTTRNYEWINVLGAKLTSVRHLLRDGSNYDGNSSDSDDEDAPRVMLGWLTIYSSDDPKSPYTKMSARMQLLTKMKELLERYRDENPSVILTGHSLGATLATLGAFDIVESGIGDNIPVTAIVFGSPEVGNHHFKERVDSYENLKILHVKNVIDMITHYPGHLLGYVKTGIELEIDTRKSPFLKESKHEGDKHNLQGMLHVVAGWNGERGEFEMRVKRSLALVNKSCDFLKDEYMVPPSWWVEKNKGMRKNDDGEWVMALTAEEDLPVPEFD